MRTPREWIEWQANRFAEAVLMPRLTFPAALCAAQREIGIIKHIGTVYLDEQTANVRDFVRILEGLSNIYSVSKRMCNPD